MFNTIFNDAPQNWQTGFQDPATPGFTGIIELHDTIFFYLIIICVGVFWVLGNVIFHFNSTNSSLVHKYLNHGTNKCLHSFFYRFSKNINLYSLVCYYLPFFKLNCTVTATLSQGLIKKNLFFFCSALREGREVGRYLSISQSTVSRYLKSGDLFKNKFSYTLL